MQPPNGAISTALLLTDRWHTDALLQMQFGQLEILTKQQGTGSRVICEETAIVLRDLLVW